MTVKQPPLPLAPEKKRAQRRNKCVSIYPAPETANVLGGHSTTLFQLAAECWVAQLLEAGADVEELFVKQEWAFLAQAEHKPYRTFSPLDPAPGARLSECAHKARALTSSLDVKGLCRRLEGLTYAQAWAVIWALIYKDGMGVAGLNKDWWQVTCRLQHPLPKKCQVR